MDPSAAVTPPYVAGPLRLEPFRALMLAPRRIGDPASARAFARPYTAVTDRLAQWEGRGQMSRDSEPALYLHEYTAGGITIRGLVGALDVSRRASRADERAVYPHEVIHPAQADELADRMSEMRLNPAPILLVHRGSQDLRDLLREVRQQPPHHHFTDRAQQRHRVWAVRDAADVSAAADSLAATRALIADGHHRYGAYLRLQRRQPGTTADHGLAMLVDHDDTPLFLGAIHRVLTGTGFDDVRAAAAAVGAEFTEREQLAAVDALGPDTLVVTDRLRWATVHLGVPEQQLAVELLHQELVPALPRGPLRIGHHHSVDEALAHASPEAGVAVLLPAPGVDTVLQIVAAGRLLPEKATSFQPKPSLGVLIRSLHDG